MTLYKISIIALFWVVATDGACQRFNDNYCDNTQYHNCYFSDTPGDASAGCHSDPDCMNAEGKVCDMLSGACVQCTATKMGACGDTAPVCGANNMCTPCSDHTQCASNVCTPEGKCASEDTVAYVAPRGLGAECKKDSPCGILSTAIAMPRMYIKISKGTLEVGNIPLQNQEIILLGDPGARIIATENATRPMSIFDVNGSSSLHVYDLELSNSESNAVYINSMAIPRGQKYNLLLVRTIIDNNADNGLDVVNGTILVQKSLIFGHKKTDVNSMDGNGIRLTNGSVTVEESAIFNNERIGIELSGSGNSGSLSLSRSSIFNNKDGGISIASSAASSKTFDISNNFIFKNGQSISSIGGLSFANKVSGVLRFNTIVDNKTQKSSSSLAGVFCNSMTNLGNNSVGNIILGNTVFVNSQSAGDYSLPQISTNCNVLNDGSPNRNLILGMDSSFVQFAHSNSSPCDYHLTDRSPKNGEDNAVIGAASDCNEVDFDGNKRPPTGCDFGADQFNKP